VVVHDISKSFYFVAESVLFMMFYSHMTVKESVELVGFEGILFLARLHSPEFKLENTNVCASDL
jgi:hypothetical protein